MAKIKINGDSSGYVEIAAPNAANNNTLELGPGTKILTDSNPLSDIGSIGIATDNPGSGNILAAYGRTQLGPQSDTSDATTKAEMISKASLRVKPHPTNSGTLNFAQVDNGNGIGLQYTNGSGSANWEIALQPFGGLVGIGTDNPSVKFHVHEGTIRATNTEKNNFTELGTDGNIEIKRNGGGAFIDFADDVTQDFDVRIQEVSNGLKFVTGGSGSTSEKLRITSTGNVGIGSDAPSQKLNVAGNIMLEGSDQYMYLTNVGTGNAGMYIRGRDSTNELRSHSTGMFTWEVTGNERMRLTADGDLKTANINISGYPNTHEIDNYSVFLSDNHANTFFGQNLRLDYSSTSGNHQLDVINQHATIGGAGMLIGGNGSPYVNQLKFYTVAANQPAGTRVDDVAARMTIDTAGRVTKPNQPAFCVYKNQSQWTLASGDTFVFNTTEFNVGGHYSTSNGRFTAPVTGTYVFHFYSIYTGNASNDYVQMYKNGARIQVGDVHFTNPVGSQWDAVHYSRVIQLDANDYVYMRSGSGHTYHGNNWGGWSGYMLG